MFGARSLVVHDICFRASLKAILGLRMRIGFLAGLQEEASKFTSILH